uniref:Uncharacterized protein n=1 Tax=Cacopsylla melanoneura TaxID=428564 RepID=A0A8D9BA55_9HEMI
MKVLRVSKQVRCRALTPDEGPQDVHVCQKGTNFRRWRWMMVDVVAMVATLQRILLVFGRVVTTGNFNTVKNRQQSPVVSVSSDNRKFQHSQKQKTVFEEFQI